MVIHNLKRTFRNTLNRDWWIAHRMDMPTRWQIFTIILTAIVLLEAAYVEYAREVILQAQDAIMQNERILACMNNKGSLGSVVEHGETWDVQCNIVLRKRS